MPRGRSASLVPRQGAPLSPRALRSTSPAEDVEVEDADGEAAAVTAADKAVDERIVSRLGRQRVALLLASLDRADLALAELAESVAAAFETLARSSLLRMMNRVSDRGSRHGEERSPRIASRTMHP